MATTPIPIRSVSKTITPDGANLILLDDGTAMGKASLSSSVAAVANGLISDAIDGLDLGTASQSDATSFATAAQGSKADSAVQPGDLSTVATSGDYGDLSNLPTLGSAAAADTGDFATAAQGTAADTALQPAAIGVTVQGQDDRLQSLADATGVEGQVPNLKADGTYELADAGSGDMRQNVYDPNGTGADAFDQDNMSDGATNKNYTGTEQTKLAGIEPGADVTGATNVAAAGATMNADTTTAAMAFVLDEDDFTSNSATKLASQQSIKANIDRRAPKASFATTTDFHADTTDVGYSGSGRKFIVATGDIITAGYHRLVVAASSSTDYHTKNSGIKVYVPLLPDGSLHSSPFGAIADGTSHPLSERYGSLSDAQAAFPLSNTAGYLTSLDDTIDWAVAQEMILRCEATGNLPSPQFGFGAHVWNRGVLAVGSNKGLLIRGSRSSFAQGSTKAGTTIDYVGTPTTPEAILGIQGTFNQVKELSFQNHGNADYAIDFSGSGTGGSGRAHMQDVSFTQPTGGTAFGKAVIHLRGADYTEWDGIEYSGTSPLFVDVEGWTGQSNNFTRFVVRRGVFTAVGTAFFKFCNLKNVNVEQISLEYLTFNAANGSGGMLVFDTTDLDAAGIGYDADAISFRHVEFDCNSGTSASSNKKIGLFFNCHALHFYDCQWQDGGGTTTHVIELTNSIAYVENLITYSITTVFKRGAGDSNRSKIICGGTVSITTGTLTDSTWGDDAISVTQSGGINLTGADSTPGKVTTYHMNVTANSTVNFGVRTFASSPKGQWKPDQLVNFEFENQIAGSVNWAGLVWATGISAPAMGTINTGMTGSMLMRWNGTKFVALCNAVMRTT